MKLNGNNETTKEIAEALINKIREIVQTREILGRRRQLYY